MTQHTTCLIVGAGPTGLTTALLLAKYGIESIVVDRHEEGLAQPKAHAVNPRSLEIFRQLGLDTQKLRDAGSRPEDVQNVMFAESLTGVEFGHLPYERQEETAKAITPEPLFNIPQPILEDYLLSAALDSRAISVQRPFHWESCVQNSDGHVISSILDRKAQEISQISSEYLLLCDGANSISREKLAIPFNALDGQAPKPIHHVSVHINGDLSAFKPATLWFILSQKIRGTFICYDRRSSWVFVFNYDPEETDRSTFTEAYCREIIDQAAGTKIEYTVLSITTWSTWPRLAEWYRSKSISKAFFLGDAAHAFPPTGGLGVNTGIADAHNLAWKIHAVEHLKADDSLFDTYNCERRPVAIANAKQSIKNQTVIMKLIHASHNFLAESSNPESQQEIDTAIADNMEHFDSINLQLGYVYGSEVENPCYLYEPSVVPGARLPHTWVQSQGKTVSILDLVTGASFTLLAPSNFLPELGETFTSSKTPALVKILRKGADFTTSDNAWLSLTGLSGNTGLLLRPDQHIVNHIGSLEDIDHFMLKSLQLA